MSKSRSPNQVEGLTARSTLTGNNEYLTSTNGVLNTTGGGGGGGGTVQLSDGVVTTRLATVANLSNSNPLATMIVDGSGNQITSFGGGTQYAELITTSPATGTLSLGRYKSSAPTLTDGQMYGLQVNSAANLRIAQQAANTTTATLQNAVSATGNGSTISTDGMATVTFVVTGTFSATVTFEGTADGSNYVGLVAQQKGAGSSGISSSATAPGTFVAVCTGMVNVRSRVTWVSGTSVTVNAFASPMPYFSHSVSASGRGTTALPTAVTDGQLVNMEMDKFGRPVVVNNAFRDIVAATPTTISASTAETTIIAAIASTFNDLSSLMISNTSGTATRVDLRDTTGGAVVASLYIPAGDVRGVNFTTPWPQSSVNTNWTAQSSTSVTDLRFAVQYIKNK